MRSRVEEPEEMVEYQMVLLEWVVHLCLEPERAVVVVDENRLQTIEA
jgi:hypothetical protein